MTNDEKEKRIAELQAKLDRAVEVIEEISFHTGELASCDVAKAALKELKEVEGE